MANNITGIKVGSDTQNIGINNFSNISGTANGLDLNLQDAMNLLMQMAGSKKYVSVGNTAPDPNIHCLWLDTSEE